MDTIPLPPICITCLPPWPQAMMFAGKNIENRDANVAARLAPFVGQNIGISQSKGFPSYYPVEQAELEAHCIANDFGDELRDPLGGTETWKQTAGKLLLVARLDRIAKPSEYGRNPWHVAGQHGLVLGKVWQVEPVPCRGAVGAWKPYWCASCGAISAASKSMQCAHCKAGHAYDEAGERPQLRIVRECL